MTTIDELLKNYREIFCLSEVEKGEHFERLMKNFLLTCPVYRGKFKNVWLWKNFPYKNQLGGKDLGIDIVAETFEKGVSEILCKSNRESRHYAIFKVTYTKKFTQSLKIILSPCNANFIPIIRLSKKNLSILLFQTPQENFLLTALKKIFPKEFGFPRLKIIPPTPSK